MTLTRYLLAAAVICASGGAGLAAEITLTVESWRGDDAAMWQEKIIPAFQAANPGIKVVFSPTADGEYDAGVEGRLAEGTAGDLISCRPFDGALKLFEAGHLAPLGDLPEMAGFSAVAKAAWSTDDRSTAFCVPVGAAIHGFIYNKEIFEALGLGVPATVAEFHAALDTIAATRRYIPIALGVTDGRDASAVGYQNIGPTYWKGEAGRLGLIAGTQKLADENWIAPYRELASWRPYMGSGFEAQTYSDSQNLFTLGRAAIYPAGSWEIPGFTANAPFAMGAFPPPVVSAGDKCFVTETPVVGIGLNAASANKDAALKLLAFVASRQFGEIEANALPGLFPMSDEPVTIADPLAAEFASWRTRCEMTISPAAGMLSRGTPNLEDETRKGLVQVIKGAETPETIGARLQAGLERWYKPPK
jgi:raffinose/stachyose/melibiose transport system substrate-binding protein